MEKLGLRGDKENLSPESLCGEKPSGENPSNFFCRENPSANFATCGEKPSSFFLETGGE